MFEEIIVDGLTAVFGLFILNSAVDCCFGLNVAEIVLDFLHGKIYGEKADEDTNREH